MRVGIISDTHVPHKYETLSLRMKECLQGVDMILHCGDIVTPDVLEELKAIAPVEAVAGNHDIERFQNDLPRKKVVELVGYKIGMIHGDFFEDNHLHRSELMNILRRSVVEPFLDGEPLDVILFGHCHQPIMETFRAEFYPPRHGAVKKSILLFNPGIPIRNRHFSSIGFLTLTPEAVNIELKVFMNSRG